MKWMINESRDPAKNLALEELLLREGADEYFMLWQNDPVVVVGKHQNTYQEVNTQYAEKLGINVVRRISGGGAVYHDSGNLNFTFITRCEHPDTIDFSTYTKPIVSALQKHGVSVQLTGRNDLTVRQKKISGNSQRLYRNRLLHHGTLLYNSDLDVLERVLAVDEEKYRSKGFPSIRSRVCNLKECLPEGHTLDLLKTDLVQEVFGMDLSDIEGNPVSPEMMKQVDQLADDIYRTWDWTYGFSPRFDYVQTSKLGCGTVTTHIQVEEGMIHSLRFSGDFIGLSLPDELECHMEGIRYDRHEVSQALNAYDFKSIFGDVSTQELLACFFE